MSKVKAAYLFPNKMVATFGYDNQQIEDLQGEYTKELHAKIELSADAKTEWYGFPPLRMILKSEGKEKSRSPIAEIIIRIDRQDEGMRVKIVADEVNAVEMMRAAITILGAVDASPGGSVLVSRELLQWMMEREFKLRNKRNPNVN